MSTFKITKANGASVNVVADSYRVNPQNAALIEFNRASEIVATAIAEAGMVVQKQEAEGAKG